LFVVISFASLIVISELINILFINPILTNGFNNG